MSRGNGKVTALVSGFAEGRAGETIGERIKRLRTAQGLSQRDLAGPGVTYGHISRIEAGARTPSVKALRVLARKLGVSVEYLESGREMPQTHQRELRLSEAELRLRLGEEAAGVAREIEGVLAEAREQGDQAVATRALLALGLAASRAGRSLEAVERIEAALATMSVSPLLRPDVYATLAQSYVALGAADRAVSILQGCLEQLREDAPDDTVAEIRYATFLSYALADAGEYRRANEVVKSALARADEDPDPYTRVRLYWSMSRLAGMEGRGGEALDYIRRAIALLELTEDTLTLARAYLLAANVELGERDFAAARGHVELAERLFGGSVESLDAASLLVIRSKLEADAERAVELARAALELLGELHPAEQGAAVWALAAAWGRAGETEQAARAYSSAVDLLSIHGRRADAAVAGEEWAALLATAGQRERAGRIQARARTLAAGQEAAR